MFVPVIRIAAWGWIAPSGLVSTQTPTQGVGLGWIVAASLGLFPRHRRECPPLVTPLDAVTLFAENPWPPSDQQGGTWSLSIRLIGAAGKFSAAHLDW